MIPIGTICVIVERPERCLPSSIAGRFCTVEGIRRGQPFAAKCNVKLPEGDLYVVWRWDALRPIVPPKSDMPTQYKRELETA